MDDANLESGSKKPAVAPAPAGVFRQVRRPKLRHVVPTVVVEDEEAPSRPKDAFGLDELDRRVFPEAGPATDDRVGAFCRQTGHRGGSRACLPTRSGARGTGCCETLGPLE